MTNSEAIAVILQRICTSLLQCHGSHPPRSSIPAVDRTISAARDPIAPAGARAAVDHVEVALDRGKVVACLTDLARGERMFGVVGHSYSMSGFG